MRYFCPWCSLELTGNKHGDCHVNEFQAWESDECEYQVGSKSKSGNDKPTSFTQMKKLELEGLLSQRKIINKRIRGVKSELNIKQTI